MEAFQYKAGELYCEDVPVSMGILVDNSGSMNDKRARVAAAALTLAKESNPDDDFHQCACDYIQRQWRGDGERRSGNGWHTQRIRHALG